MKHGAIVSSSNVSSGVSVITATPGSTVTLDVTAGFLAIWTASQNETVNASGTQYAGQELTCIITNDASLPRIIAFGTGFRASGGITGTTSTTSIIRFVSDGTNFLELSRNVALV